jgi:ATP-dependent RNA helicase RhlE
MSFASFNLASPILRAVADEGYDTPTPIQQQAIAPVMAGRDLLGLAQTGTGKTAAFALPIIHRLTTETPGNADHSHRDRTRTFPERQVRRGRHRGNTPDSRTPPRCLILAPTRELATQIGESFAAYGRHTPLRHTVIYGGVSQSRQEAALRRGVDIIVATPGRLIDLMQQRLVDLSRIGIFVLDEADRMLDMGFIKPIRQIAAALPGRRQTLLFSATMPREIVHLADSLLSEPVKVEVISNYEADPDISQSVHMVPRNKKQALLEHLLGCQEIARALVFTRTKHGADRVRKNLHRAGIDADAIHGNKSQNQRERALDAFRSGRARVLVATDVAARGLDVDGITHVFNFDLPFEPEAYVHRIGRTARAGASGVAISFCDVEERPLLRAIEKLTGEAIEAVTKLPDLPYTPHNAADESRERTSQPGTPGTNGHGHNGRGRNGHSSHGERRAAPRRGGQWNGRSNGRSSGSAPGRRRRSRSGQGVRRGSGR